MFSVSHSVCIPKIWCLIEYFDLLLRNSAAFRKKPNFHQKLAFFTWKCFCACQFLFLRNDLRKYVRFLTLSTLSKLLESKKFVHILSVLKAEKLNLMRLFKKLSCKINSFLAKTPKSSLKRFFDILALK